MTIGEILSKSLELIKEGQWSGKTNTACGCHPVFVNSCPDCLNLEYIKKNPEKDFMSDIILNKHKPDCERMQLIKEIEKELSTWNEEL